MKKLLAILIALSVACVLMCSVSAAGETGGTEGTVTLSYAKDAEGSIVYSTCIIDHYVIATVSDLPENVTKLKYEFKVGAETKQTSEVTPTDTNFLKQMYRPTISDAGATITVTVTVFQDSSSYTLSPVTSVPVVPPTPLVIDLTKDGFTISNFNAAYQYAIQELYSGPLTDADWKTLPNGTITGLKADTTYFVTARVADKPTAVSDKGVVDTLKIPTAAIFTYTTTSTIYTGAENPAPVTCLELEVEGDKFFTLRYVQNDSNVTPKNAGTYQLYANARHGSGYDTESVYLGTWTINQRTVSITPTVQEKSFDGSTDATILPGALTGAVEGDDVSVTPTSLTGSFNNQYAGNNKSVSTSDSFTLTGEDAGNYSLTVNGHIYSGNIKPASHTITLANETPHIYQNDPAVDISGWASSNVSDAQLTYSLVGTPAGITLTTVDGKSMLSADSADNTATSFSVKVTAATKDVGGDDTPEYSETSKTFTVTAGKRDPGLTITGDTTKTYGDEPFTMTASLGSSVPPNDGGIWHWTTSDSGILTIDGVVNVASPQVKVAGAGSAKLTVNYISDTYKGTAETTITVEKATPSGVPNYSTITVNSKTLADAHLTVGTITPDGTIAWDLDRDTVVAVNTAYGWTFTPADSTNYRAITGSAIIYPLYSDSSSYSYAVIVEKTANGNITVSAKSAYRNNPVTITAVPDSGYTLETLKVLDQNGHEISVVVKDGKYTFTMPGGKVTVKGTFAVDNILQNFFTDVSANAYYYEAVMWAAKNGITGGVDATHFAPNAPCTRAQIVTLLWRAAGSPAPKSAEMPFVDVKADSYYYNAVLWAVENGITGGTTATTFSPDANCSRAQSVAFLWRSQKSPAVDATNSFIDMKGDTYYTDAVLWAATKGITGGTTATTFSPDQDCTRAQIVTFIYRCMK